MSGKLRVSAGIKQQQFRRFVVDDIGGEEVPTLHEILNFPGGLAGDGATIKAAPVLRFLRMERSPDGVLITMRISICGLSTGSITSSHPVLRRHA
jgi:hypothetical protein